MSMTEPERHELYELAKHDVGERFAELMIKALPPDPHRLATKDDVALMGAELRTEMAVLRTEMADLRTELKTEIRDLTTQQTRTLMLGLVGSITTLAATQLIVAAL
jgi:hypothetical protein